MKKINRHKKYIYIQSERKLNEQDFLELIIYQENRSNVPVYELADKYNMSLEEVHFIICKYAKIYYPEDIKEILGLNE